MYNDIKLLALLMAALMLSVAAELPKGKAVGNPAAPMQIEIYSDFQCPSCRQFHMDVLPSLMRDYVATGKVYLIHRDVPRPMHQYSREAAAYAAAAARLSHYDQVADALFRDQASWSANGKVPDTIAAAVPQVDTKQLQALSEDPSVIAEVQSDYQAGQAAGVNQTPTMIVNYKGKKYTIVRMLNYSLLRRFLDDTFAK